jgi:hypothetical protein
MDQRTMVGMQLGSQHPERSDAFARSGEGEMSVDAQAQFSQHPISQLRKFIFLSHLFRTR